MQQDYAQCKLVLIDDSTNPAVRAELHAFAKSCQAQVVRTEETHGRAAGFNAYLRREEFDYFVPLGTDEILPPVFITRCLDYFALTPRMGMVQATHQAGPADFLTRFRAQAHSQKDQLLKYHHGFLPLCGAAAMISRFCYDAAGGFPERQGRGQFSLAARHKGYFVCPAPDLWTDIDAAHNRLSGWRLLQWRNLASYVRNIIRADMTWYEKLDAILSV